MSSEPSSSELVDRLRSRYALSPEEVQKHSQTFKLYDKNNNGLVSLEELAREVDAQAQFFKDKSLCDGLRRIYIGRLKKFSKRDDNQLTYAEFIQCKQYGKIADGFKTLKYKGDYQGYVEPPELKTYLMAKCKSDLNEELIDHVLSTLETDPHGKITFHAFMDALFLFVLSSESETYTRPLDLVPTSPVRAHLHDEVMLHRLRMMFRLSESEEKEYIDHFKKFDARNSGAVTFADFLSLDGAEGETESQAERRHERIRRIVELSPNKTENERFTIDDFLTLKKGNKVYAYLNENEDVKSDYVLKKEALRKYLHHKIWLKGVSGRFMDELLDMMGLADAEEINIDDFAISLSAVIFPLGKVKEHNSH